MKPPRKWEPADPVVLNEFLDDLRYRRRMYFFRGRFRDRPVHVSVLANMSIAVVWGGIQRREIRRARVREAYREWLRDELLGSDRCRSVRPAARRLLFLPPSQEAPL